MSEKKPTPPPDGPLRPATPPELAINAAADPGAVAAYIDEVIGSAPLEATPKAVPPAPVRW